MIFPDASRTGDNNDERHTGGNKHRLEAPVAFAHQFLGARALDEHRRLACADVGDAELAFGGLARRREMHGQRAQDFAVAADQRRRMHCAHAIVAGESRSDSNRGSRSVSSMIRTRARDARHRARTHAALAQGCQ